MRGVGFRQTDVISFLSLQWIHLTKVRDMDPAEDKDAEAETEAAKSSVTMKEEPPGGSSTPQ